MRNWSKISVLVSVLATTFAVVPTAAEASPAKPIVVSFTAAPSLFYKSGGTVSLTAHVANTSTCTFTSDKVVPGLPAVVECASGTATTSVTVPGNAGKNPLVTKFFVTASGSRTKKSLPARVTVNPLDPRFTPATRSFTVAPPTHVDVSTLTTVAPTNPIDMEAKSDTEVLPIDAVNRPAVAGQQRAPVISAPSTSGGATSLATGPGAMPRTGSVAEHAPLQQATPLERLTSWNAAAANSDVGPPDPQIAASSKWIVEEVNSTMYVYDRTGRATGAGTCTIPLAGLYKQSGGVADPRVVFDTASGQFISAIITVTTPNSLLVAATATGDPCGAWNVSSLVSESDSLLDDQPRLGFSADKVTLAFDQFDGAPTRNFSKEFLYVMDKAEVVSGNLTHISEFNMSTSIHSAFGLTPAIPLPGVVSNTAYAMYHRTPLVGASQVRTIVITGLPSAGTTQTYGQKVGQWDVINDYTDTHGAQQPGVANSMDAGDGRYISVEQRSSGPGLSAGLWSSSDDGCNFNGADHDCVRLTEVGIDNGGDVHTIYDADLGIPGSDIYNGAVMGDCTGDHVMVAYTHSGVSQYPTAEIDGLTTPAAMGGSAWGHSIIPMTAGSQAFVNHPNGAGNGHQRWGDYANIFPEDSCGTDGWAVAEYGADSNDNWATAVGEFTFSPPVVGRVTPWMGSAGTVVDIYGSGFTSSSFVAFGSVPAWRVTFLGSDHLSVVAPPHAPGIVDVTVTTELGTSATVFADQFRYEALAWVATTPSGSVDVINLSKAIVVQRLTDLQGQPQEWISVAPDGANAYVTSGSTPFLYEFSGQYYVLMQAIALNGPPVGSGPPVPRVGDYSVVSPDGAFAYVTSTSGGALEVVDLATKIDIAEILVSPHPTQIALNGDGTRAYVTDPSLNKVFVVDLVTRTVIGFLPVPGVLSIAVNGNNAWVGAGPVGGSRVVPLDISANPPKAGLPISVEPSPTDIVTTPDGNYIFVSNHETNLITRIHRTGSKAGIGAGVLTQMANPAGLAVVPDGTSVVAALTGDASQGTEAVAVIQSLPNKLDFKLGWKEIDNLPVSVAIAQPPKRACNAFTGSSTLQSRFWPPGLHGYPKGQTVTRLDDLVGCSPTGGPQVVTVATTTSLIGGNCAAPAASSYDWTLNKGNNTHFFQFTVPTCAATYTTYVTVSSGGFVIASRTLTYTAT